MKHHASYYIIFFTLHYITFIISENDEIYERKECTITQNTKKHYTTMNKPAQRNSNSTLNFLTTWSRIPYYTNLIHK